MDSQIHAFIEAPAVIREILTNQNNITDPFNITQGIDVEQFSSVLSFRISDIKSIAKKQGVSFNAVLVSIYGNGIGKYLVSKRDTSLDSLVVATAQPWPGRQKNFIGNRFNFMVSVVPLKVTSPIESLDQVQAQIVEFYSTRSFIINKYFVTQMLSIFPSWILEALMQEIPIEFRCSLSPVLSLDEYVYNGRPIRSSTPLSGIGSTTDGM